MALIRTLKFGNATVEVYDDYVPEDKKENLRKMYDAVNDIAQKLDSKITKNWFLNPDEIQIMKKSEKYSFL